MSTAAPSHAGQGSRDGGGQGHELPKVPTVDGPRPYFAAAQALDPPPDLLRTVAAASAPSKPLARRLTPTAYQLLLWLTLDLWGQHDRRGPVTSPSMEQLRMWCGLPYVNSIPHALNELATAGVVSIGKGRARTRNRYGLTFDPAPPERFAVPAMSADLPMVRALAQTPGALTGSRSLRTLLLVSAVAMGTDETFQASQTTMRYAARLSRTQHKSLLRQATAQAGTEWDTAHRWLERVATGRGPEAPTTWRLRVPGYAGVPWPGHLPGASTAPVRPTVGGHE